MPLLMRASVSTQSHCVAQGHQVPEGIVLYSSIGACSAVAYIVTSLVHPAPVSFQAPALKSEQAVVRSSNLSF